LKSIVWLLFKAMRNDLPELGRRLRIRDVHARRRVRQDCRDGFGGRCPIECPPSYEHFEDDTAERKNVARRASGDTARLFRRHIRHRPHNDARLGDRDGGFVVHVLER
jgi:hypothetical protein